MKRGILCGLLAAALLVLPARAARTVPVQVDGQLLTVRGTLESGVTYIPLRTLLDTLGGWSVWWDSAEKEAVAVSNDVRLTADPEENTVTVNGQTYDGQVYVKSGRTYVPLRLTMNLLGGSAAWDPWLGGAAVTSRDASHDAADLYWLSRIISAESRGESLHGQIAVGNVVLNRVESPDFPDTIPGVIFDRVDGVRAGEKRHRVRHTHGPIRGGRPPGPGRGNCHRRCPVLLRPRPVSRRVDQRQPHLCPDHRLPPLLPVN